MKKICRNICFISIIFLFIFSGIVQVQAKQPNVADCLENKADCPDKTEKDQNEKKTDQEEVMPEVKNTGSLIFDLIKMVFALFLVLGLIYLLLKFLKKRNKLFHQVKALENLGGISVGQNKSIQVVRIGSKVHLIGVGENVEMLQEITDEEVKRDLLHEDESTESESKNILTSFLHARSKTDKDENVTRSKNEFKSLFSKELEKLKHTRTQIINDQIEKEDKHE